MTSFLTPWLLYFLVISILFIALVEVIRRGVGNQVFTWQTIGNIMVFWLSSYTLFFILDYFTTSQYLRARAFSWPQAPLKAVIILSIIASIWYTVTSQTPVKTPIPITFFIYKNGIIQDVKVGPFLSKEEVEERINKIIP